MAFLALLIHIKSRDGVLNNCWKEGEGRWGRREGKEGTKKKTGKKEKDGEKEGKKERRKQTSPISLCGLQELCMSSPRLARDHL